VDPLTQTSLQALEASSVWVLGVATTSWRDYRPGKLTGPTASGRPTTPSSTSWSTRAARPTGAAVADRRAQLLLKGAQRYNVLLSTPLARTLSRKVSHERWDSLIGLINWRRSLESSLEGPEAMNVQGRLLPRSKEG